MLQARGLVLEKPHHWLGYEVDGTVELAHGKKVLVEIKTSKSAADIHAAVGQLHLYRALITSLSYHTPILLLPASPSADVVKALVSLGIAVHIYQEHGEAESPLIVFDQSFRELLGIL